VFWILESQKRRRLLTVKIKKKLTGWTGSRVDPPGRPGFPGPIPERVLPPPGPVPGPGQPGPGSTRRAGPGFKTLELTVREN